MTRSLQLLFCVFLLLTGCKHEEPNPELLDPIYSDLVKQQGDDEGKLAAEQKALAGARDSYEGAEPNTLDLKNAQRQIERNQRNILKLEQKVRFDKIRVGRRLAEDHLNYHKAFLAGKDWPDKEEYPKYLVNQRLLTAPRDWDARVPKLFNRKPAAKAEKKKEAAAE